MSVDILSNGELFIIAFLFFVFIFMNRGNGKNKKAISVLYEYEKGVESIPYNSLNSGLYVLETMANDKLLFLIDDKLNIVNLTEEKTNNNLNIICFLLKESFNILSVERLEKGLNAKGELVNRSELQLIKRVYLIN